MTFDVSADGRYVAYVLNEDGRSRLTVIDNQMKLELSPPGVPEGRIGELRFDHTGKRLAFSAESAQSPRDVYVYDLDAQRNRALDAQRSRAASTRTRSLGAGARALPDVGSRQRPAAHRSPRTCTARRTPGPHPVLINIHGGPGGQYRPGCEPFFQFLVNELGYAVIAPNVRGSSGYGKTFLKLDNGVLREDAVKDIGSLLVWVGVQPMLDRDRVVVHGRLLRRLHDAGVARAYSDRLRGGIDVVGISNFNTFLNNTAATAAICGEAEYGDERDPHMRVFLAHLAVQQRDLHPAAAAGGAGHERSARAGTESEQMVARCAPRRRSLVSRREGRRPRLSKEVEPRRLLRDCGDVPGEARQTLSDLRPVR